MQLLFWSQSTGWFKVPCCLPVGGLSQRSSAMQKPDDAAQAGPAADAALKPPSEGDTPDASFAIEDSSVGAAPKLGSAANRAPLKSVVSHDAAEAAGTTSIYDFWTPRRRAITLAVVSISQFLNPISQNIVLPGLKVSPVC